MIVHARSIEIEQLIDPDGVVDIEITINPLSTDTLLIDISEKTACKMAYQLANIIQDIQHAKKSTETEAEYHTTYNKNAELKL